MKTFAAIQDGVVQDVTATDGFTPPPREGVPYVEAPWFVQTGDTTPDNGQTWARNGQPLVEPEYEIPVGRIAKELTDAQVAAWLSAAFPGCNVPLAVAVFRMLAQETLMSTDPRLKQLRPAFESMFGVDVVKHLLRPA